MKWSAQQLQCLEALGVPVYAFKPPAAMPSVADNAKVAAPNTPVTDSPGGAPEIPSGVAATETAAETPSATVVTPLTPPPSSATTYFYRLGPWVLALSDVLPVDYWPWLRDLAAYCNTLPSQVSPVDDALNIDAFAQATLTPEQKKQLWRTLKAKLPS